MNTDAILVLYFDHFTKPLLILTSSSFVIIKSANPKPTTNGTDTNTILEGKKKIIIVNTFDYFNLIWFKKKFGLPWNK